MTPPNDHSPPAQAVGARVAAVTSPLRRRVAVLVGCVLVLGCASRLPTLTLSPDLLKDAVYYQVLGKERISLRDAGNDLRGTVVRNNLTQVMQPLSYQSTYSEHLLVVGDRQPFQVNRASDLLLYAVEGHGYIEGVNKTAVLWENEIVRIPRDTPHAFINAATQPTVLFVVFSPPYNDRQVFGINTRRGTFFVDDSTPIGLPQQ